MPPKRAGRIPAPGAERVTITGIMAACDDFDRVRIMILDASADGRPDPSAARLRKCAPQGAHSVPYELREEQTLPAGADGVRGICRVVLPKAHKKHWLTTAAELRGQWVRAEATVRRFAFEQGGVQRAGVALDLAMLTKLSSDPTTSPVS